MLRAALRSASKLNEQTKLALELNVERTVAEEIEIEKQNDCDHDFAKDFFREIDACGIIFNLIGRSPLLISD